MIRVMTATDLDVWRYVHQEFVSKDTWPTPGALARAIDPHEQTCGRQTAALDLIDRALVDVEQGITDRLIISMPPQEGKSTRVTKIAPLWMLARNPDRRVVIVSYEAGLAAQFGRDIRNLIVSHQGDDGTLDLGLRIAHDNGAVGDWKIEGRQGGVRSIGINGGITGRPADVMFIDDPISNREQASSPTFRERAKNFWTSTGSTRLAPGAPVVLILTRWHEDDLAGWLLGREDGHRWRVINIPAQAETVNDPLGREPGEYLLSARRNDRTGEPRTDEEWEQIKVQAGARDWASLYQGHPSPPEGGMFHRDKWQRWDKMPDLTTATVVQSWDLAFKDTKTSDFVVGQVWARVGAEFYLLDQVRGRWGFSETCDEIVNLTARWPQAIAKYVEDKANGPAVIDALKRKVPGLIPVNPEGGKEARAAAVSPLIEAGNVRLPARAGWVDELVEECASFPNAPHDDQVDALTQALVKLIPAVDAHVAAPSTTPLPGW